MYHRVNLSTMPPLVAAPVVLVCAELLAERGGMIFCVASLLRRGSMVSRGAELGRVVERGSATGPSAAQS